MTLLQVFHKHRDDHVDENELRHQYKNDEKYRRDDGADATIFHAIGRLVAVVSKRILHDAVPIVTGGYAKEGKEGHTKVTEMRVLAEALARCFVAALYDSNYLTLYGILEHRFVGRMKGKQKKKKE